MTDQSKETAADPQPQPQRALSRRRFASAGVTGAALLALANRPAFGAVCTPSGFVSFSPNNPSGMRHSVTGCGGWSPGAWKNPDSGNGDGSRQDWITAGAYPNPRGSDGGKGKGKKGGGGSDPSDPPGTLFSAVFGGGSTATLHDVLLGAPGSLEFHTIAAWLNARLNEATGAFPGYMNSLDVVGLYQAKASGAETYTTIEGSVIPMLGFQLKDFFEQTYH